MCAINKANVVC